MAEEPKGGGSFCKDFVVGTPKPQARKAADRLEQVQGSEDQKMGDGINFRFISLDRILSDDFENMNLFSLVLLDE